MTTGGGAAPRALFAGLVDYAGLFPPASLAMREAAAAYGRERDGPDAWMLGRFVVPLEHVEHLAACRSDGAPDAWPVSVTVTQVDAAARARIESLLTSQHSLRVESVEAKAMSVEAIREAARVPDAVERYVELPLDDGLDHLVRALAENGLRGKVRTGGTVPGAVPTAPAVARFIVCCIRHGVPFKATAGLHHSLRAEYPLSYAPDSPRAVMFGYLNVFLAAALAAAGAGEEELVRLLEERDVSAFEFTPDVIRWRGNSFDAIALRRTRAEVARSFGSCSFREPVDEARTLALL